MAAIAIAVMFLFGAMMINIGFRSIMPTIMNLLK